MAHESREQRWVARAAQGDTDAFRALYREHARAVYWIANGMLRSEPDAEDVMQDTFITAWKKIPTVTLVSESALPWLATICRYTAGNLVRTRQRERARFTDDDLESVASPFSVEATAINAEHLAEICRAIDSLTPLDQKILRLCALEGYAYDAAARELGISHATVRNRLSRTRRQLRATIHEEATS